MLRSCFNNKFYKNKEEKKKKFKFIQAEANFCFGRVLKIMSKAIFKKKEKKLKEKLPIEFISVAVVMSGAEQEVSHSQI